MAEVLFGLALLALGFYAGRKSAPRPRAQDPGETERLRLQEDRAAFTQLMGYSADRAYGKEE